MSLLVAGFTLAIFLLLELENLFEWRLSHSGGDFIFTVKVLYPSWNTILVSAISSKALQKTTYHFAQQQHVLTAHQEDAAGNIGVDLSCVDALNSVLKHKVCCIKVYRKPNILRIDRYSIP